MPRPFGALAKYGFLTLVMVALVAGCGGKRAATPNPPVLNATPVALTVGESTTYYNVAGADAQAVFASIAAAGLQDADGSVAVGLTSREFGYRWTADGQETCHIESLTITLNIVVTLPRLDDIDLARPALASRWPQFAEAVAAHEAHHVRIAKDEAESVRAAMADIGENKSGCHALSDQIAGAWSLGVEREKQAQLKFHAEEHARLDPARAEMTTRLESYRTQIDALKSQIDAMDVRLSGLRAKVDGFKAVTDDIRDRNPSLSLPEPELLRYNTAVGSYNATLDSYNALVAQEKTLVEAHNKAVEESNAVAENLTWLG